MKRFKDFSISHKLLAGFLSLTFLMVVISGVGIFGMRQIARMDSYLYTMQAAPINDLIRAIESLHQFRADSRAMVIRAGQKDALDTLEDSYLSSKEDFLTRVAEYRETITNEESFDLLDESVQLFNNSFDPAIQKSLVAAKAGDAEGAFNALIEYSTDIQKIYDNFHILVNNRMTEVKKTSDSNNSMALSLTAVLVVFTVLGACASMFLALNISRKISRPIGRVVDAANKIALGYVECDLKDIDSKDETGQLADAFSCMLDGIRKQVRAAEDISKGDFTQEIPLRSDQDILGLALQKIEYDLNQTLLVISSAADQVNTGAGQIASTSQELASGNTEQAATVEELNASIANVAEQAEQNAVNVRKATEYVGQAGVGVENSNAHMQKLNASMKEISIASEKISNITKVIEDIAFQTNILALNAAIEAARAGDSGRGFAVVADEVRNLAAKSGEAAKQTADLIKHSVSVVSEGEKLADETAQILQDVAEKAKLVEQSIREIDSASSEQALAVEQINHGLAQVSSVVQTNAANAEESSASSEELAAQAQALQQEVSKFKLTEEHLSFRMKESQPAYKVINESSLSENGSSGKH